VLYPKLGLEATLEALERASLRYVEYPYEMFKDLRPEELEARLAQVAEAAGCYRVVPYQLHAEYGSVNFELSSPDEGVRSAALRRMLRWVEYAARLGVRVLVVHAAFPKPAPDARYDEVLRRVIELNVQYLGELARRAEDLGVLVAVENCVEPWFCSSPPDLLFLMESVGSASLGVCVDTGHFNANSIDPAYAVERLAGHVVATHVHDNDGRHDQHLPPLLGSIDWARVVAAFRGSGCRAPLIYEFHSLGGQSPQNAVETLRVVTSYLRSLM